MTNSVNYNNQPIPGYPNITINVTGSNIAAPNEKCHCKCCCEGVPYPNIQPYGQYATNPYEVKNQVPYIHKGEYLQPVEIKQELPEAAQQINGQNSQPATVYEASKPIEQAQVLTQKAVEERDNNVSEKIAKETTVKTANDEALNSENIALNEAENNKLAKQDTSSVYPPSYYINNYNIQNGDGVNSGANRGVNSSNNNDLAPNSNNVQDVSAEEDMSSSKEIIEELNARQVEQKEVEKNSKKTKVVALTNEYIMSLENYLNNPNTDIRLMAAKDILTRLDEDKDRYDDAALNALLNKMLQDPNKLVRIAAMSAFSSELASGNQYTVTLLTQIQNNPEADPEDVLEASQILLKRSATTEVKYVPAQENAQSQKVDEK